MIYEGLRAYNRARASTRRLRTPHAKCTDEQNHRTQAPPARPEGTLNPFARITRVSAIAPNLVRVIRRLRPTEVTADKRLSPTAGAVSQAPRKRRALSVVKCLSACLGVIGDHIPRWGFGCKQGGSVNRRWRAAAPSQANSPGRLPTPFRLHYPYQRFRHLSQPHQNARASLMSSR
jgi:hypothetical protein